MKKQKYPSKKEFAEMIRLWKKYNKKGDLAERNKIGAKLVDGCEGLIKRNIRKFYPKATEEDKRDLFNECAIAISIIAPEKFDPKKSNGASFTTYAIWWIRHALGRYGDKALVRVPVHRRDKAFKLLREKGELSLEELSWLPAYFYWDAPSKNKNSEQNMSKWEALAMETGLMVDGEDFGEDYKDYTVKNYLVNLILDSGLDEREKTILKKRSKGETLDSIGEGEGLSRERIRQIESKAFETIRKRVKNDPTLPRLDSIL